MLTICMTYLIIKGHPMPVLLYVLGMFLDAGMISSAFGGK